VADERTNDEMLAQLRAQLRQSRQQEQRLKEALTRLLDLFGADASG
jgi:hypothetical protein